VTIAAACRFPEGVALITDSRATWAEGVTRRFEDRLQKILPLGRKVGLAYAGNDIRVPEAIVRHLRRRIARDPRRGHAERIVQVLPRIARRCYREYVRITQQKPAVLLIVVGVTEGGKVLLYTFDAPDFAGRVPSDDYVVVGSGAGVADYLATCMRDVDRSEQSDLKVRVDRLLPGLEDALHQINEATIGGMLQIVLADSGGIRPYTYWQIHLDPDRPPEGRRMKMKAGTWTQTDLAGKQTINVVGPGRLILDHVPPVRFRDFAPLSLERRPPKWYPVYLLTCTRAELGPGLARFEGVMSTVVAERYPATLHSVVALGVWGTNGDHSFKVVLESSSPDVVVADGVITLEHFPETQDFIFETTVEIPHSGPMFLACYIEGQRIARRALFFGEIAFRGQSPDDVAAELERQQRNWSDTELETRGSAEVVYFSLCQGCRFEERSLFFEREFMAVYSRDYPITVRTYAALGLRLAIGEHMIRLEIVHAASGATHIVTDTKVVSSSSVVVSRLHGDVPLQFSEPGPHYVSVRVNGQRVTSALMYADNPDEPYSYKLRAVDIPKPGETFVLLKRCMEAPPSVGADPPLDHVGPIR
jgi:20S proteasome alpha/beta subunit